MKSVILTSFIISCICSSVTPQGFGFFGYRNPQQQQNRWQNRWPSGNRYGFNQGSNNPFLNFYGWNNLNPYNNNFHGGGGRFNNAMNYFGFCGGNSGGNSIPSYSDYGSYDTATIPSYNYYG